MKRMRKWILAHIHPYDGYGVRATKCDDIRENIHTFSTVWLLRAIAMYIYFNFKYRNCTIVFTHYRYEKGGAE